MRNKLVISILCIVLFIIPTSKIQAKGDTLPNDALYHVVNVDKKGNYEIIKSVESYAEAKVAHTLLLQKYHNLGITLGNSFLSIENGIISFDTQSDCTINTNYTLAENETAGYLNGCYGNDAAFLEYNPATNKLKFKISGVVAWANAAEVTVYPFENLPSVSSFIVQDDVLYHNVKSSATLSTFSNSLALSQAPSYLKKDVTYYSYDTHYFYQKFSDMIDDYRNNSYQKAINATTPYYNYYQYMDHRSTSNYSPKDLTNYFKDSLALNSTITAFHDKDNYIHDILTQSLLFQGTDAFFQYQNQFGANALMMLSLSLNESALGRSYLAYTRNNLFGHAAYDSAVEENASRYSSISSSIYSHALHYLSNSYLNPKEFQFYGGFFGNKAGGMNVKYASDPYWGEKAAQYYYEMDKAMGNKDKNQYALGISSGQKMTVYKEASEQSGELYSIQSGYEGSFILLEKIKNKEGTWYRIQSDTSLSKEKEQQEDGAYNFKYSYGYIKSNDALTILNTKKLSPKNYLNITFDANGGTFYPDTTKITLQIENGKVPVMSAPTKEFALFDGWDIPLEAANNELTYKATYKDVKQIRLSEKPVITYGLNDSLNVKDGSITVEFKDGSSKEVALTTDMVSGFQSDVEGKQTLTIRYAGTSVNYEITMGNSLENKKAEMLERVHHIIKTYSGKTGLTQEAIEELTRFETDITSLSSNILTRDQIRVLDQIFQENLKPKYSVILHDDVFDMQLSGLSLALQGESGFLQTFLPKTLNIKVKNSISEENEILAKKVAKANNMKIEDVLSISGTDDFSSLKLKQDIVFSIKKPKNQTEHTAYLVYFINDNDVYQIPTTQSASRIIFTNDTLGSYVIVSQTVNETSVSEDFTEVNTIQKNGSNYIQNYVLLPIGIVLLLSISFIAFFLYRKKDGKKPVVNFRKRRNKKLK